MTYFDDLKNLAKLHAQIAEDIDGKLKSVGTATHADVMLKNLATLAENADAAVNDALSERDAVTRYWDDRIANLKARAAEQADALKTAQEQVQRAPAPKPVEVPKPARKVVAKKTVPRPK